MKLLLTNESEMILKGNQSAPDALREIVGFRFGEDRRVAGEGVRIREEVAFEDSHDQPSKQRRIAEQSSKHSQTAAQHLLADTDYHLFSR